MTSILTALPLALSLLGLSNSPTNLSLDAAAEEPIATLRFVLIEIPVQPNASISNEAPAKGQADRQAKPQSNPLPDVTPLPRPGVPEPVLGDLNFDSVINQADLIELILQWGSCPELIDVACTADFNGDQVVNNQDLSMFMRLWNQAQAWAAEAEAEAQAEA